MKVYIVQTIARQIDGEYVFIRGEGAFKSAKSADNLIQKLKGDVTKGSTPKIFQVTVPDSGTSVECMIVDIGAIEFNELQE